MKRRSAAVGPARIETANTADEAMQMLFPRHAIWGSEPSDWIFRGHGDIAWPLLPSAYRPDALLYDANTQRMTRGPRRTIIAQIEAEWRTLRLFLAQVDQAGLPFASADDALFDHGVYFDKYQSLFNRIASGNIEEWPPSEVRANLGLAQHYGVHTRFLDWTGNLSVAGYFAAAKAAEFARKPPAKWAGFEVWALRVSFLDFAASKRMPVARIVRVPRAHNPNLHAQAGLFVNYWAYGKAQNPTAKFVPRAFDTVIAEVVAKLMKDYPAEASAYCPPFIRVQVPGRMAAEVLRMLAEQGAGPVSYFPGYAGAARALQEREYWP